MFRRFLSPPSLHSLCLHLLLHHLLLGLLLQSGPHGVQGVHRRSRLPGNSLRRSSKDLNANLKPEETENGILRPKTLVKKLKEKTSVIGLRPGESVTISSSDNSEISRWRIIALDKKSGLTVEWSEFCIGKSSEKCSSDPHLRIKTDETSNRVCGCELPPVSKADHEVSVAFVGNHQEDNFKCIVRASKNSDQICDPYSCYYYYYYNDYYCCYEYDYDYCCYYYYYDNNSPTTTTPTTSTPTTSTPTTSTPTTSTPTTTTTKNSTCASCGKINRNATRDNRVVGGQPTKRNEYPQLVSIYSNTTGKHACGGVIICDRWIATAAHCFDSLGNGDATQAKNNIIVHLGAHNLSDSSEEHKIMSLDKTLNHPNYSDTTYANDIALGRLSSAVKFAHAIQPACLADSTTENHTGKIVSVIGWGNTAFQGSPSDVPLRATPVMISRDVCRGKYPGRNITEDMICAFKEGKDACQGDSGGPLFLEYSDLRSEALGLVSWGEGCGQNPGVYTSVAKHLAWIKKEVDCDVCTR
ncbi:uncharacterized protein LOC143040012 [Oratosquilla oratoria]|uniref:uncharacterized protein LOC143040012 n=1 Tax=Oratosquilla oratoria TaxID=337810 RepID=UPI003F75F3CB